MAASSRYTDHFQWPVVSDRYSEFFSHSSRRESFPEMECTIVGSSVSEYDSSVILMIYINKIVGFHARFQLKDV